ncbi:hypothetical protein PC120_g26150 [Phytophthora cactorum]|nr:hypothetical protein PC120_g26150 [Phytophthora cactorum]
MQPLVLSGTKLCVCARVDLPCVAEIKWEWEQLVRASAHCTRAVRSATVLCPRPFTASAKRAHPEASYAPGSAACVYTAYHCVHDEEYTKNCVQEDIVNCVWTKWWAQLERIDYQCAGGAALTLRLNACGSQASSSSERTAPPDTAALSWPLLGTHVFTYFF